MFLAEWTTPAGTNRDVAPVRADPLAGDLVLQRAFEDVDDLFARMRVPGAAYPGSKSMRT
jgi:hypothetical protein